MEPAGGINIFFQSFQSDLTSGTWRSFFMLVFYYIELCLQHVKNRCFIFISDFLTNVIYYYKFKLPVAHSRYISLRNIFMFLQSWKNSQLKKLLNCNFKKCQQFLFISYLTYWLANLISSKVKYFSTKGSKIVHFL